MLCALVFIATLGLAVAGCGPRKSYDGPTVDSFTGRVTQDGKPVKLPEDSGIQLYLAHEKGQGFGIPLDADGSFKIGWMPIGKYMVLVETPAKGGKRGIPGKASVEAGLTIEAGKTDYTIELGDALKQ